MYNFYTYLKYFHHTKGRNAGRTEHSSEPLTTKEHVSKGFHALLSLVSMVLKCISHLLYKKIFLLKLFEFHMKLVQLLSFAIIYIISK